MKLPTTIKIGKTPYAVNQTFSYGNIQGQLFPRVGAMVICTSTGAPGRALIERKPEAIAETFWHEVTHAILHDMDHPLWRDEGFVTAFSQRLAKAIDSARFE